MKAGLRRAAGGFTLVEVLVALLMMALLTTLAWQALDGVLRARDDSRVSIDRTVRLSTVLSQWEQDLLAVYDTETVPALAFDGQTLRLTRRVEGGVAVVAWSVRSGQWQRWAAAAVTQVGDLQDAWLRSQQLLGTEPGTVTLSGDASQWQVYFARGGQWTNAQSTGDFAIAPAPAAVSVAVPVPPSEAASAAAAAAASAASSAAATTANPAPLREVLPEAVRLQITLGGQTLTRDIGLGPTGT